MCFYKYWDVNRAGFCYSTVPDFRGTGSPSKKNIRREGRSFQVGTGVGETGVGIVVPGDVCGINVVTEGVGYAGDAGRGVGTGDVTVERGTGGVLIPGV